MVERKRCTGCGACAALCPRGAVRMVPDREGFLYPAVDRERCDGCGACAAACPLRREEAPPGEAPLCFGARAKDAAVRAGSSSGGIFPLLAGKVLAEGGVIAGAALMGDGTVRHAFAETPEDLRRLAGTKYVQSSIDEVLAELPRLLEAGRRVLFCGTPCQAAAVRRAAGASPLLITVDLVCYGVPSPGVWRDYVRYLERKHRGRLSAFTFRDKAAADHGRAVSWTVGDHTEARPLGRDPFCRSYFARVNLRPACSRCRYCTTRRGSDITLGDFWGVEEIRPGFDDGGGCSVVLCHTPAGRRLWEAVRGQADSFPCTEEEAANPAQPRLRCPTPLSPRRRLLMGLYRRLPFPLWLRLFGPL